jgi:hypothetical protein
LSYPFGLLTGNDACFDEMRNGPSNPSGLKLATLLS